MFRLRNKLIIGIAGLVFLISSFGFTYYKGYDAAKGKYLHAEVVAELKGVQDYEKVRQSVMRSNSTDLDRALLYWMRDN